MSRIHVVSSGNTLAQIAEQYYGDPQLYEALGRYNGIRDVNRIEVGQEIEIPSKRELLTGSTIGAHPETGLAPPHGLDEIAKTFGNLFDYLRDDGSLDPSFEREFLTRAELPFAIPLSWDPSLQVRRLYCHVRLAPVFPAVFETIRDAGLQDEIHSCGGCFNFRAKRTSSKFSTHSWGIAIDLNVHTNPLGKVGDMHEGVVEAFRAHGFKWGGDWPGRGKDPMHFQFCTGY